MHIYHEFVYLCLKYSSVGFGFLLSLNYIYIYIYTFIYIYIYICFYFVALEFVVVSYEKCRDDEIIVCTTCI